MADAQERVHRMVEDAEARTADIVADAEDRLAAIRTERDAVAGYLENLRGVLTHATGLLAEPDADGADGDGADGDATGAQTDTDAITR